MTLRSRIDALILKATSFNSEKASDKATFRDLGFSGLNLWDLEDRAKEEFGVSPDLTLDTTLEAFAEALECQCTGAC